MHTTEVHIDVPCADHIDQVSKLSSMKFRLNEDIVKIYRGAPEVECTAVGTSNLTTARTTIVYHVGDIKVQKRWPLPNATFEWFAKMSTTTLKRVNVRVTHCVSVEVDAFLDSAPKTTIIWKLSGDDDRQEERVMSLITKLVPTLVSRYQASILQLRSASVWNERS